jgi:hypothetical protein
MHGDTDMKCLIMGFTKGETGGKQKKKKKNVQNLKL